MSEVVAQLLARLTTTLPSTGTNLASAAGIDSWNDTDEYGNPRTTNTGPTPAAGVTPASYGWHGTAERSSDTPAGLTLMGARLYNPITGLSPAQTPSTYCTDTCRKTAWTRRHKRIPETPQPTVPQRIQTQPAVTYACPRCHESIALTDLLDSKGPPNR